MMNKEEESHTMSREELHELITDVSGMQLPRTVFAVEKEVVKPMQVEIDRLKKEVERLKLQQLGRLDPKIVQEEMNKKDKTIKELKAEVERWKQKYHKEAEQGDIAFTKSMTQVVEIAERDKTIKELTAEVERLNDILYPMPEKDGLTTTYQDGTVLTGSWKSRIEQWKSLKQ